MRFKIIPVFFALFLIALMGKAQENKWAFGFYGDVQLDSKTLGTFGVQSKYDVDNRSAVQAQVYGRNGYFAVGADYLFSFLNKTKTNWNIFLGAGASQDFYRYNEIPSDVTAIPDKRDNFTVANGQAGVSYYFPSVDLSVYTGYKVKYNFKWEEVDANFLMLGLRYHIW
ncbi:hypothetical protein ORI89_09185 [Sphingobacterium sp. UT-1RO-CII-1]|uniref:hypothetical protein n=1 Tax=Sphingobacterium sp. UT-1RO-CII-1 TaxID=2995225 RepID=UPI00227CCF25|nr:hypothetical protein [Sphingobacterium sp. UT-1RO-CII-1]MCY4779824.1 hypothetical protein [Sphingobacterium sp. UT-1RO-CII-1]